MNKIILNLIIMIGYNFTFGYSDYITMIVIYPELKVYNSPSVFSDILTTLKAGQYVIYSQEENKNISNNTKDWLYVDTELYEDRAKDKKALYGWIKKNGVARLKDFERVTNFESFKVVGSVGDLYYNYTFYKNGTYIRYNEKGKKIFGKVYKKGVVFMARDSTPTDSKYYLYNLFVLDEEGYYNFPCEDENGELVRIKSKLYAKTENLTPESKYAILTGDNVNIRAKPGTNSVVLTRLKKGARVKVLERSEEVFRVGDREGLWVYVETDEKDKEGKPICGWMVDIYLKPEE